MKPIRIQRKRTKGWRMPENAVYVGRPTIWGNPFKVGDVSPHNFNIKIDNEHAVMLFEQIVENMDLTSLKGKNLACFCPLDKPCHADVLLKLANE